MVWRLAKLTKMREKPMAEAERKSAEPEETKVVRLPAPEEKPKEQGSAGYWFLVNLKKFGKAFAWKHKISFTLVLMLVVGSVLFFRATWQPAVLWVRIHTPVIIFAITLLAILLWQFRARKTKGKIITALVIAAVSVASALWIEPVYNYIALYFRYKTLTIVELEELPTTDHERIQPLNSIYSLAHEKMVETETPMSPDFVRIGDEHRWTMAIEPSFTFPRIFAGVDEVFSVSGTSPSPNFNNENRIKVHFPVGESLLFGRNYKTAVIRNFGPWRFLSYSPKDVTYVVNDKGKWVMVVSLIKWTGIFFPRPEFGGVQVIEQEEEGLISSLNRSFKGVGRFIPPKQIAKYPYLVGQNILSYDVSRYDAQSFRYQNGFMAPFPDYHRGDIRIPDLSEDVNEQPFTTYFEHSKWERGGLYHYFALEPYENDKQGLNTSVFIPADGSGSVYVYKHHFKAGSLTGVSAISAKVKNSRIDFPWTNSRPVEHRPYIKIIDGKTRFFWLTTIVTLKTSDEAPDTNHFIAGSAPATCLTEASNNIVVWVDSLAPETWEDTIKESLSRTWAEE